jgi:hypothetical protein
MIASIIGALAVGGASYGVEKVMQKLKSGKAGKLGEKIAAKLEEAGKAAGSEVKKAQSKGKY